MANKDGVLSIGIEYKSELNKMIADLEGGLDTISKNNQLSKGMKQQFNNVIAEVRSFKATMEKELATLGSGKVDKTAFKSFKQTVANNFKSVREDIDRLDLAVSTLNSQMEIISKGVDLSKITKEFASFEDYINRTNEAVSQLIDTLGQQGISLFSFDNRNLLDTKSKIKEIDDIISQLDNDKGAKFELFNEKDAQAELDRLSVQLRSTLELMEHTEKQMSNMDSSTVGFKKMQGDFALLQLKAASLNDTIEMLYTVTEDKGISIEMDDKSFELYDKYTEDLSDNLENIVTSAKNAKKELSSLLNSQKQPSVKVSSEMNPNSSELSTTITIETTSSDLWKKLSPILTDLQDILNFNPVVAPVKLVVAPNAVSSTENGDVGKVSNAYSKKYAKVLAETGEDAVIDLEGVYKKTFTSIMDTGVSYAKETISKIQDIFDKSPINIKYDISQKEIDKIQNFVLSNKDGKKVDVSGQIIKAKQDVEELNANIEKTSSLLQETQSKGNIKFEGFEKFTNDLSKSIGKLEELQNILKALQNIEITLAKSSGLSSITEIELQWENLEKRIINATKVDGSFRKNASVSKIASEYQKYIDMGGTNSISDISKIKENKDTIDAIISKAKEFQKQDFTNDSIDKLSVDLDSVIAKFDELISTVKTATNALYKIIKQGSVSDLDKQWSSISNKFKSIADESGKINLSKQKKDIEELLVMYQRYVNMGGSHTPFDLTDNLETLSKLDKAYKKLNETKPIDNSSTIKSETESFKQVEQSVDSLTKAIGGTKVDAINIEATAMEDAAEREILAINAIVDNLNMIVSKLKEIKGIKIPKIQVENVTSTSPVETNISSENTIPQTINQQEQLKEAVLDTATAYEKMTEAEKEARKSAIQTAVNSIPQAENTARYVHWGNIDQSKSILSNPNGMSTGDYGLISSFADCLGEAETSMEAIYKYWESLHAEGFDKGSALVIDIPLDEVKEFERGLKDNIPQEYIKGFVDTESNAITLNTTLQNGLKETAEQAEKTAQSVQDISKTQIKDVIQGDEASKINEVAEATNNLADAENKLNIVEDKKSAQKYWQGRFEESVSDITKTNEELVKMKQYYSELEAETLKYQNSITSNIDKLSAYTDSSKYTDHFISRVNSQIDALQKIDLTNPDDINKLKSIEAEIATIISDSKNLENRLIKQDSKLSDIISKMKIYRASNSNMSKTQVTELTNLINTAQELEKIGKVSASTIEEIKKSFSGIKAQVSETGNEGLKAIDRITQRAKDMNAKFFAQFLSFQDWIRYFREGFNIINDIDKSITELRKVSNATEGELNSALRDATNTAKELGASINDVVSLQADWARLGYSIPEAEELARVTQLYVNVGDNMSTETASENLISTLQGFQLDASEAQDIIDKFNEVANNYAIDTQGIGEALKRSAASFNAANTSLSESIALITTANAVVQDPDSIGTTFKTLSARIRGAETELEQLGQETDDYTKTTSKLRDLVKSLTGFDIMIDEDTFKSVYEILLGIGKEWDKLTDVQQASLGEALAGKRNANVLYSVMQNIDQLEAVYKTAEESAGSAQREQENYQKSIQYSIDTTKASLQELVNDFMSSDFLKGLIDAGRNVINIFDEMLKKGKLIPTILGAIGSFSISKNFKNSLD